MVLDFDLATPDGLSLMWCRDPAGGIGGEGGVKEVEVFRAGRTCAASCISMRSRERLGSGQGSL